MWRNPIIGFLLRFVVIYGLLIAPWPGWDDLYSQYFRGLGEVAFSREGEKQIVIFDSHELHHGFSSLGTRITLGNRESMDSSGKGLLKRAELDTRSIGWIPTALTMSLILATPVSWQRRGWALAWGMVLVHAFILFSLQAWIWDKSPDVSLSVLSPFWKAVADDLDYELITQLGASFSVPVIIWIVVTFRRQDVVER